MSVHTEGAFEENIETHLLANGWVSGDPSSYDRGLGLDPVALEAFVKFSQPDEWVAYVDRQGDTGVAAKKLVKRVADEIDARGTVDVLRRGVKDSGVTFKVAFFAPANRLSEELWRRYDANTLSVVRQLHHSESNPSDSVDLALFVNGIPIATAELKNHLTNQTVAHAMEQYRSDRNPADLIFAKRTVVHFAVDSDQVYMTTRLAGANTVFLPFNLGSGGAGSKGGAGNPVNPDGYRTSYLWERVWQRDAWLGLLADFVHVEDTYDATGRKAGTRTLFPRFHQWDAVTKLLAETRVTGPGVNRLVQHSAGSGKSNTIAWLAHGLSRLHTPADPAELTDNARKAGLDADQPVFHKVVVITDRKVLDRQLQDTVAGFEHTPGTIVKIDEDSAQLKAALEGATARVIITTLQKFPVVAKLAAEDGGAVAGQRFAVIVDEAHSSTTGESTVKLKAVLGASVTAEAGTYLEAAEAVEALHEAGRPDAADLIAESAADRGHHSNLAFFAFTATPKPRTLELFGESGVDAAGEAVRSPFHLYSMRQAIEEGFILDVLANYTSYATYYRLANAGGDDPEVPAGKAGAVLARFVSLHPSNLAQKAEVIVEHFRAKTRHKMNGQAKAMVVTRSRLHAVRYKQAIDAYIAEKGYDRGAEPLRALVAFSGSLEDPDTPDVTLTEAFMNGFPESQLPAQFASDEYQVLVVAEKYQTGFDQPLLHTMYVDKKLSGVAAVQTLSRLNRTHSGKSDTFVLDFANTGEEIQEAFRPFYEQTLAAPTDPNLLYTLQRQILDADVVHPIEMTAAVEALLSGQTKEQGTVYANLGPAVERYLAIDDADVRARFRSDLTSYVRAYAFLAQVMPWTERDLEELYLYGKALLPLPGDGTDPLPQLGDAVRLTHLRTEARAVEESISLTDGTDEPGVALPGGGAGKQVDQPRELLSVLIDELNSKFGMNLGEADAIWFEQQKAAVLEDGDLKVVALNNDARQYRIVLEKRAEDAIVDRHEANGELFDKFFADPSFKARFLDYLASTYDEFRDPGTASG
jgi:type I restriction enzyme R subunit